MRYLLLLIFVAEEPAETSQCEHSGVWVGKRTDHTQNRAIITHPIIVSLGRFKRK